MNMFKELDLTIRTLAKNDKEYKYFTYLVSKHLEGHSAVWDTLPDVLKIAIAEWENQQAEQGRDSDRKDDIGVIYPNS